ncbi:DUF932 domain-containing protein (plasmid) [Comamonas antarctica]|uniref:DUF932 domain-containing protein n=1 Tax=Comamonas antarctica TaxID=2743470 RepID=A0A6N1XC35_9BURK|nr:DUF932 domain-containing protein [Comamonas antarctica]
MQLASRFASHSPALRSDLPLTDVQIREVAPSIFAQEKHSSRSERYSYIATSAILSELRKEGFDPFMVCQTRVRDEGKREHTKHMVRLRHAAQVDDAEANELTSSPTLAFGHRLRGKEGDSCCAMQSHALT